MLLVVWNTTFFLDITWYALFVFYQILFNKNDESVKKSFDILTIYEKASGSKVNYEKTKGMYVTVNLYNQELCIITEFSVIMYNY